MTGSSDDAVKLKKPRAKKGQGPGRGNPHPKTEHLRPHQFKRTEANGGVRDPKINMKGPNVTGMASLRRVILTILNEEGLLEGKDGKAQGTLVEDMIRMMVTSRAALDRKTLLEYAVGKVATPIQQRFDGPLLIQFVDETGDEEAGEEGEDDGAGDDGSG